MMRYTLALLSYLSAVSVAQLPHWPDCYIVVGSLHLPYAELTEPFTAFFEAKKNRSRIDFFDIMQTYQIGSSGSDGGYSLKVAPMTTEEFLNEKHCFQVNGTSDSPVQPQSIFPDISGFSLNGKQKINGKDCNVWRLIEKNFSRTNTYTLWQSLSTGLPVRYEMMGYDSLLGSHYDKYFIDYEKVTPFKKLTEEVFRPPANLTCNSFPGPGMSFANMNPMSEFIHGDERHVEGMFQHFKNKFDKNYQDEREHEQRKHYFRHNLRFINAKNRASLKYKLAVNHFADLSEDEMRIRRGRRPLRSTGFNGGLPFNKNQYNLNALPDQIDWRFLGAVSQVKDQATCGSCWSFGTVGAIEGAYFLKTGELVRFSQQELVDCSWGQGNNGCDGGEDFRAYQWIMKHGLATEDAYGPYMGVDGYCKMKTVTPTAKISGYVNVTANDSEALKAALVVHGPISIAIDASHRSLSFYSHGVYDEPQCSSTDLDHAVLLVGYGVLNNEPYWLVKNSWSTYWGNDGYVLMSQKNNMCGVLSSPTFVQF